MRSLNSSKAKIERSKSSQMLAFPTEEDSRLESTFSHFSRLQAKRHNTRCLNKNQRIYFKHGYSLLCFIRIYCAAECFPSDVCSGSHRMFRASMISNFIPMCTYKGNHFSTSSLVQFPHDYKNSNAIGDYLKAIHLFNVMYEL